ncbi:MAG: ECF transporter S component [Clostridia bacterium]|nr:ECF transporter S component [Clostridia bacterium]MDD4048727.1 ECF transporter S component [Clostridia bacterium]
MQKQAKQLVLAGILIAIGLTLPIVFHSFNVGPIFLPMHLPILLGGFILSPFFALLVGAITPLMSSFITGMPIIFPTAIKMTFELATYGYLISYLYHKRHAPLFLSLIGGMLGGRIIAGLVNYVLLSNFLNKVFSLKVFLTASFVTSLPGIIIQLLLIPVLVKIIEHKSTAI